MMGFYKILNLVAALGVATLLFGSSVSAQKKEKVAPPDSWITKSLAESGKFILESEDSVVWGCAPIYDEEGKVHVYYSVWEEEGNWLTHSKIAHAVADHPEGPYKKLGVIMEGRKGKWDAHTIHNPNISKVDGKYVLLYIGNDTLKQDNWRDRAKAANTQRVGMAIADSPYGPWKRFDKPIIDVAPDSMAWDGYCTVNPSFMKHPNGEYWIYYRAWDRRNDDRRKTGVAMAKNLEGPYVKYKNNPVIDFPERGGQTEDPYFFHYKNKFHCLIRDMGNYDWLSGFYLESEDGLNWGEYQRSHHKGSHYFPICEKCRYERVQVLWKNGHPEYLFNAIMRDGQENCGAVLKINLPKKKASEGLTKPKKFYTDSVDFSNAPKRINDNYPLSDQKNNGKWKMRKDFGDEFNSNKLDTKKWYPNNPKWKGRPPTRFHGSNVTLENGDLVMRINQHGDEKLPEGFTHSSGFIKSKKKILYGYFEARIKPMDAPWVTGFWMTNVSKDWWTEIDICENCPGVENNRHDLNSNIHVFKAPKDKGDVKEHFSRSKKYYIPFELQKDYHVWGLEWDEDFIRFYLDGVLFREAENTHWHQPLEINFNCESNKWFGALPDDNRLNELYKADYFRVWQKR